MNTNSVMEALADKSEKLLAEAIARIANSRAPSVDRVAGEIDHSYKLGLIDYPRRDALLCQLRVVVNNRRQELLEQRHADLLRVAS